MQRNEELKSDEAFSVPEGIPRQFSLDDIIAATDNFNDSFAIGQGGFAKVYRGEINDANTHTTVAIKKSKSMSPELRKEFRAEILMVTKFQHSHLVSLIGYCETENEMILIYEYMAGGTLEDNLHRVTNDRASLCWVERLKLSIGAARGLDYLHTGTGINNKVIHRDIKSSNILLDENRSTAKIADFGMSKIGPANQADTRVMTRVVGTFGYLDPDYYSTGFLTSKSDVYAFGVVLFELLCGRPAVNTKLDEGQHSLAKLASECVKKGKVDKIIDPNLNMEILPRSLSVYVKIANKCLNAAPKDRPTMTEVLAELVLALSLQENGTQNGKKSINALHVGGSKLAEKLMMMFSVTPRPTEPVNNISERDTTEAASNLEIKHVEKVSFVDIYELRKITNNFGRHYQIGQGGSGKVYNGKSESGQDWRIKNLNTRDFTADGFFTNVFRFSNLYHKNVVKLLNYCFDDTAAWFGQDFTCILIYEYAPDGSLDDILHGKDIGGVQPTQILPWSQRVKFAVEVAKGLEYLHEMGIIHGSIKSRNVLLYNGVAKIVDIKIFDVSLLTESTAGHTPPPYYWDNQISTYTVDKIQSDVYSFGELLLELLTGRTPVDLVQWVLTSLHLSYYDPAPARLRKDIVDGCMDPRLKGIYKLKQAAEMMAVAVACVQVESKLRPSMSSVVKSLQAV